MWRNRDGDMGRDIIRQGWNSNMVSVETGISDMTELEESRSGVGLEVQS